MLMSREELIGMHYGVVDIIVDKILSQEYYSQFKQMRDDLHSEGTIGMIKAIDNYDETRGAKLITYISLRIRGYVLNHIAKHIREVSPLVDIENIDSVSSHDPFEEEVAIEQFDLINKYEPKHLIDKEIYHRILMGGSTTREIANEFNITKNAIKKRKARLIAKLREQITEGERLYED
jgi:RNA polymerase sporulation-specific sigma factor